MNNAQGGWWKAALMGLVLGAGGYLLYQHLRPREALPWEGRWAPTDRRQRLPVVYLGYNPRTQQPQGWIQLPFDGVSDVRYRMVQVVQTSRAIRFEVRHPDKRKLGYAGSLPRFRYWLVPQQGWEQAELFRVRIGVVSRLGWTGAVGNGEGVYVARDDAGVERQHVATLGKLQPGEQPGVLGEAVQSEQTRKEQAPFRFGTVIRHVE